MEITDGIKDYLYKKLAHLKKFISSPDDSALCEVELGKVNKHHKNGDVFRAEINLSVAGQNFRAVSETDDLLASIDIAKDEMVEELKSSKDKKISAIRRGGAKAKSNVEKNY